MNSSTLFAKYDCMTEKFTYLAGTENFSADFNSRPLWKIMTEDGLAVKTDSDRFRNKLYETVASDSPFVLYDEMNLKKRDGQLCSCRIAFMCEKPKESVLITITPVVCQKVRVNPSTADADKLTGLMNRFEFCNAIEAIISTNESKRKYSIIYIDINKFKAINDLFSMAKGDDLLIYIADTIRKSVKNIGFGSRISSDRFAVFISNHGKTPEEFVELLHDGLSEYDLPFEITFNAGIYVTDGEKISADSMLDRAVLAQSTIKGSYRVRYKYFTEDMRRDMLGEHEIIGMMAGALSDRQFIVYYQPQYNHSNKMLIGAEALVRWNHPEKGLVSPAVFIPLFEKNGFITALDLYVFEEVCRFLRRCIDNNCSIVPISSNFSRYDIFESDFIDKIEEIRKKYDIPAKYLRIEITESAVVGGSNYINEVIGELHKYGYIIEMDDFGSGYSSLNVLKNIDLDIIKLDMKFLSHSKGNGDKKSGTIISSIVRMAKWLSMPVIAEGVETVEQADFLSSIGCDSIQGFLYSKPVPEDDYFKLISGSSLVAEIPRMHLIETLSATDFWNPESQDTLIFNNYVGGAVIFEYHDGCLEILRVNKKYLQEIGMNITEQDLISTNLYNVFDEENREIFTNALIEAVKTGDEQMSETWRTIKSPCCGEERICIRSNVRMIGKTENNYLFYAVIKNITAEKEELKALKSIQKRFNMASEQVKIYYWEYNVLTHEMRPCFRCMRDLGLPPVLHNYPESAIEMGVFPPETADMYRDWHVQIANGVKELEAIIPLTMDRIPFHVRYTTEFDENGFPIKAYGSAAPVTNE
jgi:diguanylate cyclase (GGDEF)-like protein